MYFPQFSSQNVDYICINNLSWNFQRNLWISNPILYRNSLDIQHKI